MRAWSRRERKSRPALALSRAVTVSAAGTCTGFSGTLGRSSPAIGFPGSSSSATHQAKNREHAAKRTATVAGA